MVLRTARPVFGTFTEGQDNCYDAQNDKQNDISKNAPSGARRPHEQAKPEYAP